MLSDDEEAEDADLDDEMLEEDEEGKTDYTPGACPRRVSTSKIPDKKEPIPNSSSLFLFGPTNK